MKLVYSDKKSGRTAQLEIAKESESLLIGKRIGEVIEGNVVGLEGCRFLITGLSDKMGSPSRREVEGSRKARVLISGGAGMAKAARGERKRRLVRGNTISAETGQVNSVMTEQGAKSLEELFPKKAEAKKEEEPKQ